jgi:CRISPR/Cas system-associated exonuclease Cas4 (RecB family)
MDLIKAIDLGATNAAKENNERRQYIGASNIGNDCELKLQYSLRGYPQVAVPAPVLRIFKLGHVLEDMVVEDLAQSGLEVMPVDPKTGEQWEYTMFGGHVRGHADGIIVAIEEGTDKVVPVVLEIKSMNDKKWQTFKTQGIRRSHPVYFSQMQLLMALSGSKAALMVAYNKNTSLYHVEEVEYDEEHFIALFVKVRNVIRGKSTTRISNNPLAFECRYCNYRPHCWPHGETALSVPVECVTCKHAKPVGDRKWHCTLHGTRATEPCKDWYKVEGTSAKE